MKKYLLISLLLLLLANCAPILPSKQVYTTKHRYSINPPTYISTSAIVTLTDTLITIIGPKEYFVFRIYKLKYSPSISSYHAYPKIKIDHNRTTQSLLISPFKEDKYIPSIWYDQLISKEKYQVQD